MLCFCLWFNFLVILFKFLSQILPFLETEVTQTLDRVVPPIVSSDCILRSATDVPRPEELINSGPVCTAITAVRQKDCVVPTSVLLPGVDSLLPNYLGVTALDPLLPKYLGVTALYPVTHETSGVTAFCEAPGPLLWKMSKVFLCFALFLVEFLLFHRCFVDV